MTFMFFIFALVATNICVLYKVVKTLYGREMMTRLDPVCNNNCNFLVKSSKFWLLGDSRAAQWNVSNSLIEASQMINLGLDGQTSCQVLLRSIEYLRNYTANYIIIQVGINDLKIIGIYPKRESFIIDTTIKNIKSLLSICKRQGCNPIYSTILPTGPIEFKRLLFWNRRIDRAIREVNDCMISYCQENEIMVLDLYSSLLDKRGKTNNSCYKDFLHLNDDGYKIMNSCLEIFFQNEFLLKV